MSVVGVMLLGAGAFLMYWAVNNPTSSSGAPVGPVTGALNVVRTGNTAADVTGSTGTVTL